MWARTVPVSTWLTGRVLPLSLPEALTRLHTLRERTTVLACYVHFFPDEWAASTATREPAPDEPWSAAEMEFFELVNA